MGILTTHPIQYQAPWFRALAQHPEIDLEVLFCHQATPKEQAEAGFGVEFDWDIPLLAGFSYRFLKNVADHPTVAKFSGLDTPQVKEVITNEQFEIVIVNGWHYKSAWQAINACWRNHIPILARGDSHLHTPRHPMKRLVKKYAYRYFISKLNACLSVGEWSKSYFTYYGAPSDRVFCVPHVVDEVCFSSEAIRGGLNISEVRARWGLTDEACVFLFVGKFVENKRPMDFIRAIEKAAKKNTRIMGLMVGDGLMAASCKDYVERYQVPVRFTGFLNQSEIVRAYNACNILVLPSDGETWGMAVHEAMSCGKPCIVTDQVGCYPDLIISRLTGDVYPMGQIERLQDMMSFYSKDIERLRQMGVSAAKLINDKCSIHRAVEGTLEAIDSIL